MKTFANLNFGIIGGGFGLYGYLPAVLSIGVKRIKIPENYKSTILLRKELVNLNDKIVFLPEERVFDESDYLIYARRPEDNYYAIKKIVNLKSEKRILLEKPITTNPLILLNEFKISPWLESFIETGFIFKYTEWFQDLNKLIKDKKIQSINIEWKFLANHYHENKNTWKRDHSKGGGALRFYGIHFIGILSKLGYDEVINSETISKALNDIEEWKCSLAGKNKPKINIYINSKSKIFKFKIYSEGYKYFKKSPLEHPYNEENKFDYRLYFLQKLLKNFISQKRLESIKDHLKLWKIIEEKNIDKYEIN